MFKKDGTLSKGLPPKYNEETKAYSNKNITIMKPTEFIVGVESCFENYHFSIPTVETPPIRIDNRLYNFKANRGIVVNPDQPILVTQSAPAKEYTVLFVDKKFINEIAYSICGKSEVQFVDDNYILSKRTLDSFNNFIYESTNVQPKCNLMLDSISTQIAILLLREVNSNISSKITDKTYSSKSPINKAIEFIEEYYNCNLSLDDLCKVSNLSPYHFTRIFKSETGKTPHEYLLDKKISKALEMIKLNKCSLNEVAQACGFISQSHFSTVFKSKIGVSPSTYKKEM